MMKSISYMIKRIIVGVGIILVLGFINSCEVHALNKTNFTDIEISNFVNIPSSQREKTGVQNITSNYTGGRIQHVSTININSSEIPRQKDYFIFNLLGTYTLSQTNSASTSSGSISIWNQTKYIDNFTIAITWILNNGSHKKTYCEYDNDSFYCPAPSNYFGILNFEIQVNWVPITSTGGAQFYYYFFLQNSFETAMLISKQNNNIQQQQVQQQQQTNQELNDMNDFLNDTSAPSSSEMDFSSNNANNGVITQLITMPINLVRSFLNGFNSSCQPFVLGDLLGTVLTLPCVNLSSKFGVLWNMIDVVISGLFIYSFGKKCVKIFNDVTNLKENQIDEVFD